VTGRSGHEVHQARVLGFKSFVEPTEFVIERGLTGVVGPNGCGKSNLVEAMRWVMGENSYKNMRASGMDDVIFSGSGNRPARNTAEVGLYLDNSDRTAPAAFNNSDEIQVTRRIERESGSVYRINGKEARAKDVQLLFADASTGARSPSMVGQGRIGELIQAKPQARRQLLEEAAGISGLHSRRHEAELRLRAAETNLERLDDVTSELESQVESLKRQARQANRFKILSAEVRQAEATLLHLRWSMAKAQEAEAESALAQATSRSPNWPRRRWRQPRTRPLPPTSCRICAMPKRRPPPPCSACRLPAPRSTRKPSGLKSAARSLTAG
jgi:chromosome segregation protein